MRVRYNIIIYSTTFTFLLVILLVLLLITPGDIIYHAVSKGQIINIFIVGAIYILTAVIALFIYATRIYTNRTILASSPKTWIPVDQNDVPRRVRHLVMSAMSRSAEITYDAKPKDLTFSGAPSVDSAAAQPSAQRETPVWGNISHPGYSAPSAASSSIPPHTSYVTVTLELPHLIEARAVSLLPTPAKPADLLLIQRSSTAGLRDYLVHLSTLGLVEGSLCTSFLSLYERARFSGQATTEAEFSKLMAVFGTLLHSFSEHGEAARRRLGLTADDGFLGDDASLESRDEEGSVDTDIFVPRTRTKTSAGEPSAGTNAERRDSTATVLMTSADGGFTTGRRPPPPLAAGAGLLGMGTGRRESRVSTVERTSTR
jgi:hypothetical protein